MDPTDKQLVQFNEYYSKGAKLMDGLIQLAGHKPRLNFFSRRRARRAIAQFELALALIPTHWQSLFFIGKLYQTLGLHELALQRLETALKYEHTNFSVAQEASLMAMQLGQNEKGLQLSAEAVQRAPEHVPVISNHALNLLITGADKEALAAINHALELDPNDKINVNIKRKIESVMQGSARRPTFKEMNGG